MTSTSLSYLQEAASGREELGGSVYEQMADTYNECDVSIASHVNRCLAGARRGSSIDLNNSRSSSLSSYQHIAPPHRTSTRNTVDAIAAANAAATRSSLLSADDSRRCVSDSFKLVYDDALSLLGRQSVTPTQEMLSVTQESGDQQRNATASSLAWYIKDHGAEIAALSRQSTNISSDVAKVKPKYLGSKAPAHFQARDREFTFTGYDIMSDTGKTGKRKGKSKCTEMFCLLDIIS